MLDTIDVGEIRVSVTRKAVKNIHLAVHPPDGRVTLVAPTGTRLDVARAYVISRLGWIRKRQEGFAGQARESQREFVTRESHFLWGQRYLLAVEERDERPTARLSGRRLLLTVRPGSDRAKRAAVVHEWHKTLLHEQVPALIEQWAPRLRVRVAGYFLQRMRTKWGSCNHESRTIRLNTELVKKPRDLLEYVVVHELVHLRVPSHGERFVAMMDEHFPSWREARAELNALPVPDAVGK
jgi:predicted metal-dependent hydrolase